MWLINENVELLRIMRSALGEKYTEQMVKAGEAEEDERNKERARKWETLARFAKAPALAAECALTEPGDLELRPDEPEQGDSAQVLQLFALKGGVTG